MASIYLHIPFCRRICGYCDFYRSARLDNRDEVVAAMLREIDEERDFISERRLRTIYFGGGTPSTLAIEQVGELMERVGGAFDLSELSEVTLEANPDDLTPEYLRGLRSVGINRLSIGVQSFDDAELRFMNRRHDGEAAKRAVEAARAAGFNNIAIDLIFGVSGFGADVLARSLSEAIALGVEHIAAYHLTIEEGTLFARRVARGEFEAVAEQVSEEEYCQVHDALCGAGYDHYEISNYALPGRESQHNSAYWSGAEYLGIGAGAHSFGRGVRRWSSDIESYLVGGDGRYESEVLSAEQRRNEAVMLSLRRAKGLDLAQFDAEFGAEELQILLSAAEKYVEGGDLVAETGSLYIPSERFLRSDMVIEGLFK